MNLTKLKYACDRAKRIHREREQKLKCEKHVELTDNAILQALRDGDFKIRKKRDGYQAYIRSYVVFAAEEGNEAKQRVYDAAKAKLAKELSNLLDELVLGDEAEALKLLRAFEQAA